MTFLTESRPTVLPEDEFQPAVRKSLTALSNQIENAKRELSSEIGAVETRLGNVERDAATLKTDMTEIKDLLAKIAKAAGVEPQ